jgi:hypothetical protein
MILRLAFSAVVLALGCSTAGAAGWNYKMVRMFDDNVGIASTTSADGRQASFVCNPAAGGLTFFSDIEVLDKRPNHRGEQKIDYRTLKVTIKWSVDGVPGPARKWEKHGPTAAADATTSGQLLAALRSAKRDLVVTWGRTSVAYSAAGASKALSALSKACS